MHYSQPEQRREFIPPPVPSLLEGSREAEVWLDAVTAALTGFCGAVWSNDGKKFSMPSQQVVAKAAVEVADAVIIAYVDRIKKK